MRKIYKLTGGELAKKMLNVVFLTGGKEIPYGALTIIAGQCGLSRERVRQLMVNIPRFLPNHKQQHNEQICWFCRKSFFGVKRKKFCSLSCKSKYCFYKYHTLDICTECGFGFLNPTGLAHRRVKFCSKACQGRWLSKSYGWGSAGNFGRSISPTDPKLLRKDLGRRPFTTESFQKFYRYSVGGAVYRLLNLERLGSIKKVAPGVFKIK